MTLQEGACFGTYTYIRTGVSTTRARSRTFRSGYSEAVRLPKDVAFGEDVELVLIRSGDVITMYPARVTLFAMIDKLSALPRPQSIERRDNAVIPERDGL